MSYDDGQFNYVYKYGDHLGNIRLSYTKGSGSDASTQIQEKNYYPYGLTHRGYNGGMSSLGSDAAKRYGFGERNYKAKVSLAMSWAANFIYESSTGSMSLQFIAHPEGQVSYDDGQFNYVYNYVRMYRNRLVQRKIPGKGNANSWESIV